MRTTAKTFHIYNQAAYCQTILADSEAAALRYIERYLPFGELASEFEGSMNASLWNLQPQSSIALGRYLGAAGRAKLAAALDRREAVKREAVAAIRGAVWFLENPTGNDEVDAGIRALSHDVLRRSRATLARGDV